MILFAMEHVVEHAVPQNVTSFEFHLVGDMTLKQFGYLAAGMLVAYITFATFLTNNPFLALPIIGLSAFLGVAFAFFPIADRPLDHWVMAFFRAVYSPTQGQWKSPVTHKAKADPADPTFHNRLQVYLANKEGEQIKLTAPEKPEGQKAQTPAQNAAPAPTTSPTPPTTPLAPNLVQLKQMSDYIHNLQGKLSESQQEIQKLKAAIATPRVVAPPPLIPTESGPVGRPASTITPGAAPVSKPPQVAVVSPKPTPQSQPVLTSQANIINGIVTDAAGNYLEGAIVSVHDKNGMPVRASKTNKLGQFAGATPLPPGVYTLTLEKDNLEFDTLEVTLSGEVLTPLNIRAKKGAA